MPDRPEKPVDPALAKTRICKHMLKGTCKRGKDCNFAHDPSELQERPDAGITRMCKSVETGEPCHYGDTCKFAHNEMELTPEYKTTLCINYCKGICTDGDVCIKAHGPEELAHFRKRFGGPVIDDDGEESEEETAGSTWIKLNKDINKFSLTGSSAGYSSKNASMNSKNSSTNRSSNQRARMGENTIPAPPTSPDTLTPSRAQIVGDEQEC